MQSTMKDIASMLNISITTVSHALNGTRYVSEQTKKRVFDLANELGYVPNSMARSLKNKQSKTIGIIIPNIVSGFFPELVRACEDEAYKYGYTTILCNSDESPEKEQMYCDFLRSKRVDGILIATSTTDSSYIKKIITENIPVVFMDRYPADIDEDYIGFDNAIASRNAVSHLIKTGHRKIAFVTSNNNVSSVHERLDGYKQALSEAGIPFSEELICRTELGRNFESNCRHMISFLEQSHYPDAMLVTNSTATYASLAAFNSLGMRCPEDIALVGFCDFNWYQLFSPYLTMVDLPVYNMGQKAFNMLMSKIKGEYPDAPKQHVELETTLVVRDSCGAHRGAAKCAFIHL